MQSLRTAPARALTRGTKPTHLPHTVSRQASSSGHASGPQTESFGKGFYIAVTVLPVGYVVYNLSSGDTTGNPITKAVNAYSATKEEWAQRNALHTAMVEKAGHDRNLFLNTKSELVVDLKFPEVFSTGSPYNVPAGHGTASMEGLVAHYREKAFKEEEEKHRLMKEGKLPAQIEEAKIRSEVAEQLEKAKKVVEEKKL